MRINNKIMRNRVCIKTEAESGSVYRAPTCVPAPYLMILHCSSVPNNTAMFSVAPHPGWQMLGEAQKGLRGKCSASPKVGSPSISYFVADLSLVAIYQLFEKLS